MSATRRKILPVVVVMGFILPPLVALIVMYLRFGSDYSPTSMLIGLSVGSGLVFLMYAALLRMELKGYSEAAPVRLPVFLRLLFSGVAMGLIAIAVTLALEYSTFANLEGSSTNPVAVFLLPFVLLGIGLAMYYAGWLIGAMVSKHSSS